jgi:lysophospholipase L1-like esterase
VTALVTASVLLTLAGGTTASTPAQHWVGSWIAPPSDGSSFQPTLSDQTLRMIVSPHLGGGRLRIHLSNRFGRSTITLGPVTVAIRGRGSALARGSLRKVTFAGTPTVTIRPGAEVISNSVRLPVRAFEDLAISVAIPGSISSPTEHFSTRQTNYLTPPGSGNHAADYGGGAYSETTGRAGFSTGWYFLDGLDLRAPPRTGAVVTFGDSITDGFQGNRTPGVEQLKTIGTNGRYPDDLQRRIDSADIPLSVLNAGISGNRLLRGGLLPLFGPSGLSRFKSDALSQPGARDVIVLEGINDIGETPALRAQQLISGYKRIIREAHAAGVRIQLGTLTPAEGTAELNYGTASANRTRDAVNKWIRRQHLSDGIVDFDAAVRDPHNPGRINPRYDGSDHLHFNLAGYRAMARAVNLKLLAPPGAKAP